MKILSLSVVGILLPVITVATDSTDVNSIVIDCCYKEQKQQQLLPKRHSEQGCLIECARDYPTQLDLLEECYIKGKQKE